LQAYIFKDYWEDIGTIKSFYEANLALAEEVSFPIMASHADHVNRKGIEM
jgi:ADP-glucose pyrophosphorylase